MPQTYKNYQTWEVALRGFDAATESRVQSGDIIEVRQPTPFVGLKETSNFLWLKLFGLDDTEMEDLKEVIEDQNEIFEKRRYSIPLERLVGFYPTFSVSRANDVGDFYQPFSVYDYDTLEKLIDSGTPLPVEGLVYDKLHMRYL
jgi:hypothetical protein